LGQVRFVKSQSLLNFLFFDIKFNKSFCNVNVCLFVAKEGKQEGEGFFGSFTVDVELNFF
jgi:hypothetical protein